jgi:hypothetical protein
LIATGIIINPISITTVPVTTGAAAKFMLQLLFISIITIL